MPRFYRNRRHGMRRRNRFRNRRRYNKRKGYSKIPTTFISNVPGAVFPDRLYCKMVAADNYNAVASALGDVIYNANSPTNIGGTLGGTPRMFSYLSQLYTRYTVYGCKIRVDVVSGTAAVPLEYCIVPSSSSTAITSLINASEQPRSKMSQLVGGASITPRTLIHFQRSEVPLGITRKQLQDTSFAGSTTGPPGQQWYYHVVIGPVDGTSPSNYTVRTRLTYYLQWWDRLQAPL